MPKSRGRRPGRKRSGRENKNRRGRTPRYAVSTEDRMRAMIDVPILKRVGAAEAQGDAGEAARLIELDLARRSSSELFWHPDRIKHLLQITVFESVLPSWAYSRWILNQAVRWLDGSGAERFREALDRTIEVIGGLQQYAGADELDSSVRLMDHDWVYRQLLLYEGGALQHFLDHAAAPALIAKADHIRDWAETPMGAYRLLEVSSGTVTWWDLVHEREVPTANIGSASVVDIGEHVIGRLVPISEGSMFESVPIFVPPQVAAEVARDPAGWASAVERGFRVGTDPERWISTHLAGFGLLTDVPPIFHELLAHEVEAEDPIAARVGVILAASERDLATPAIPEPGPVVSAILLEPSVFRSLASSPVGSAPGFERLARQLASPAAELCVGLAMERGQVA